MFFLQGKGELGFITTWETTGSDESITLPLLNVGTYDARVDWGDDSALSTITAYNDADRVHTYSAAGTYTVTITGICPGFGFNNGGDKTKIRTVVNWGSVGWLSLSNGFYGCSGLTAVTATDGHNLSSLTSLHRTFAGCSSIATLDVSGFDTSLVTSLALTFFACSSLTTLDVSGFDTSLVESMYRTFRDCSSIATLDVSGFDTSSVTDMGYLFSGCSSIATLDLSGFDPSSVTTMTSMFYNATSINQSSIDGFLSALYSHRNTVSWATPAVDISPCATPSGAYQDGDPPTTGLEYVYELENDPEIEGFNTWSITYS